MIYLLSVFLEFRLKVQTKKAESETIGVVVKGKQSDVMTAQEEYVSLGCQVTYVNFIPRIVTHDRFISVLYSSHSQSCPLFFPLQEGCSAHNLILGFTTLFTLVNGMLEIVTHIEADKELVFYSFFLLCLFPENMLRPACWLRRHSEQS